MQKIKYFTFFVTQSYFSVPKGVRLNSKHYLILKINNRKEWQNIAINHSVDIDHNDFARIYRKCTRMTVTDQLKIIDNKNKANQVQYDLDRLAAKICILFWWFKEIWIFDWWRFGIQTRCIWRSQIWLFSIG